MLSQPCFLRLCGSGYRVHYVANQLYLEWKLFTDFHILIYFRCTAGHSLVWKCREEKQQVFDMCTVAPQVWELREQGDVADPLGGSSSSLPVQGGSGH